MAEAFTWFSKLTDVLEQVPDEGMRQRLAYAIVMYGSADVEPELEWPLNALFEAVREDIDNSRAARVRGRKGGRPRRARKEDGAAAEDAQEGPSGHGITEDTGFSAQETAPTDSETILETTSGDGPEADGTQTRSGSESDETTGSQIPEPDSQTGFANPKTIGFENPKTSGFAIGETQTKPNQAKPSQTKPGQTRGEGRAGAPTPPPKKPKRFEPPSVEEVEAYGRESGYRVDALAFTSWHESRGWKVGNQPMKDWRAAVRTWWLRDHPGEKPAPRGAAPKKRSAAEELAEVEAQLAALRGGES